MPGLDLLSINSAIANSVKSFIEQESGREEKIYCGQVNGFQDLNKSVLMNALRLIARPVFA